MFRLKNILIGKPMQNSLLAHEKLTKVKALAVYSSDAVSSVAYAIEEILWVLAPIGGYVVMEQKTGIRNADLGIIFIAPSLLHE